MNLAKDNTDWQRTLSVTPLPAEVRRRAALQIAGHAPGDDHARAVEDCRDLLEHLGLRDPDLRSQTHLAASA
uniref:Uncharacterized protein n=1 Tax=Streptomyces sp. NBC_00003 TaxID=2903608 RepID=A0AAU2V6T7_9ACTN